MFRKFVKDIKLSLISYKNASHTSSHQLIECIKQYSKLGALLQRWRRDNEKQDC